MSIDSVQPGFRRFCCGLPWVGSQPLNELELNRIRGLVAERARRQRPIRWIRSAIVLGIAFLTINLAVEGPLPATGKEAVGFLFACMGLAMVFAGGLGALVEIALGFDPKSRLACGSLVLSLVAGIALDNQVMTAVGGGMGIILGNACLFLRFLELSRSDRLLRAVDADVRGGSAWRFEGQLPVEEDEVDADQPSDDDRGEPESSIEPANRPPAMETRTLLVLPRSRVVLAMNGEPCTALEIVAISQLAVSGLEAPDAPFNEPLAGGLPADTHLRQRHLTLEEVTELRALIRREQKRLLWNSVGMFWAFGVVARMLDIWLRGKSQVGLSLGAFLSVTVTVVLFALPAARRLLHLRRDLRDRRVVITRSTDSEGNRSAVAETLYHSGLTWTHLGNPGWWRQSTT